jgi:hypothetical protein
MFMSLPILLVGGLGIEDVRAQGGTTSSPLPPNLRDRGTGVPSSMFGTYIEKGKILIYPFFEYYRDDDMEYDLAEWGYGVDRTFLGKLRASEGLIFVGYGLSDRVALEFEASTIDATFNTSPKDTSGIPATIKESGLGNIQAQLRVRLAEEKRSRPEIFGFLDVNAPTQRDKLLIGDKDWEIIPGIGFIRGYSWGTMTFRATAEYNQEEKKVDIGEVAVEYLKRLSPSFQALVGIEGGEGGGEDEWVLIPEMQWRVADGLALKLNSAFGITPKAPDWEPEVGLMIWLPFD